MKNRLFKSGCGLLIAVSGVLLPLSLAQADSYSDRMHEEKGGYWNQQRYNPPTDALPSVHGIQSHSDSTLKGPQGPIRTERMDHRSGPRGWVESDKHMHKSAEPDRTYNLMYGGG